MRDWPDWRNACVVRARTIATDLRLIEFTVEGGLPVFKRDARTRVRPLQAGSVAAGTYVCVNVGEDRMRVLVGAPRDDGAARFMWSLVEGARVRVTVPAAALSPSAVPARIAGCAGLRLCLAAGGLPAARHGDTRLVANSNRPPLQHFSF